MYLVRSNEFLSTTKTIVKRKQLPNLPRPVLTNCLLLPADVLLDPHFNTPVGFLLNFPLSCQVPNKSEDPDKIGVCQMWREMRQAVVFIHKWYATNKVALRVDDSPDCRPFFGTLESPVPETQAYSCCKIYVPQVKEILLKVSDVYYRL